ncbi:hypothetical protein N9917_00130 [Deltaproteobacteria bacterium]|nr:hypothetical protein [Deltaproteobacteria bacterium]
MTRTRTLTAAELADTYSEALVLTVWDHAASANVRGFGPFASLQAACDALAGIEADLTDDESILLTGTDETGYSFDAAEPCSGDTAVSIRKDLAEDAAEHQALCRSEARHMAGMAYGNQGLADYDGLELDPGDWY